MDKMGTQRYELHNRREIEWRKKKPKAWRAACGDGFEGGARCLCLSPFDNFANEIKQITRPVGNGTALASEEMR